MIIAVDKDTCISCGACVVICPQKAIVLQAGSARILDEKCTHCQKCIYKCYARAIRVQPI